MISRRFSVLVGLNQTHESCFAFGVPKTAISPEKLKKGNKCASSTFSLLLLLLPSLLLCLLLVGMSVPFVSSCIAEERQFLASKPLPATKYSPALKHAPKVIWPALKCARHALELLSSMSYPSVSSKTSVLNHIQQRYFEIFVFMNCRLYHL